MHRRREENREFVELLQHAGMLAYERQLRVTEWTLHTPDQARALEIASKAARGLLEDMAIVDDGEHARRATSCLPAPEEPTRPSFC